jgi:hypothetical protein
MRRYAKQEEKTMKCVFCHTILDVPAQVGRNDTCPHCNRNLHCCKQCKSYDPNAFNQCKEVSASRMVYKERGNLCEHFVLRGSPEAVGRTNKAKQAKEALEALFKKK